VGLTEMLSTSATLFDTFSCL